MDRVKTVLNATVILVAVTGAAYAAPPPPTHTQLEVDGPKIVWSSYPLRSVRIESSSIT